MTGTRASVWTWVDGRVVQLYCWSSRSELVVVDVGGGGREARVAGVVRKHEPSGGCYRRACSAGAHLVLPGVVSVRISASGRGACGGGGPCGLGACPAVHDRGHAVPRLPVCGGRAAGPRLPQLHSPYHLRLRVGR